MPNKVDEILKAYVAVLQELYGTHLKKVILYGSYAKGNYREDSDIDIMILVDIKKDELRELKRTLSDKTFDINYDYDVAIMPIVENDSFFEHWASAHPFYNNVNNEGIELYAA